MAIIERLLGNKQPLIRHLNKIIKDQLLDESELENVHVVIKYRSAVVALSLVEPNIND